MTVIRPQGAVGKQTFPTLSGLDQPTSQEWEVDVNFLMKKFNLQIFSKEQLLIAIS